MENAIFDFFINPPTVWWLLALKAIFLLASIVFAVFIAHAFLTTKWFRFFFWYNFIEFITLKIYGGVSAAKRWEKIKRKSKNLSEEHYYTVLIAGYKILDKLLERLVPVYQTDSFSTRLAYIGNATFSNTEDIWWAHELRKQFVKGEAFILSREELNKVIHTYDQALRDLEVI